MGNIKNNRAEGRRGEKEVTAACRKSLSASQCEEETARDCCRSLVFIYIVPAFPKSGQWISAHQTTARSGDILARVCASACVCACAQEPGWICGSPREFEKQGGIIISPSPIIPSKWMPTTGCGDTTGLASPPLICLTSKRQKRSKFGKYIKAEGVGCSLEWRRSPQVEVRHSAACCSSGSSTPICSERVRTLEAIYYFVSNIIASVRVLWGAAEKKSPRCPIIQPCRDLEYVRAKHQSLYGDLVLWGISVMWFRAPIIIFQSGMFDAEGPVYSHITDIFLESYNRI